MKEVKDVKDVDKIIESVTKKKSKGVFVGVVSGMGLAGAIVAAVGTYLGIPLQNLNILYQALICGFLGTGLISGGSYIKDKIVESRLKKVFEEVKTQTGIELEVESASVALEKTDVNVKTSFDEEKTHDIIEREIIKRFYMLDKDEQMQVLEFAKKTVKDYMGKTTSQTLSVLEEDDKRSIDYIGERKELKFIPKPPITK